MGFVEQLLVKLREFLTHCVVIHPSIEWSLVHCVSQYPLCTSHKFPTHRVRCTLFTVLCTPDSSNLGQNGILFDYPVLDYTLTCHHTDCKCLIIVGKKIVSWLRNVENILTSACVSWSQSHRPQHRNECQTFACLLFNGSVSNRDERTFHGVYYNYCYVVYKCKLTPLNLARMFLKEQKKYIVVD